MAARISRSGSASESASSVVLDGAGAIGDSIGITTTRFITTTGTTRGASRSTTGTVSTEGEACEAALTAPAAEFATGPSNGAVGRGRSFQPFRRDGQAFRGKHAGCSRIRSTPRSKRNSLGRLQQLWPRRGDKELSRHAEAPALVAERVAAGVAGGGGARWRRARRWRAPVIEVSLCSRWIVKFRNGEKPYAANEAELRQISLGQSFLNWPRSPFLLTGCIPTRSMAQQPGQKTFSSPEEASDALVAAAQSNDEKAMLDILGPDAKQIVSSGDETEDAQQPRQFREEISGNAPPGERTGWNHHVVRRRRRIGPCPYRS